MPSHRSWVWTRRNISKIRPKYPGSIPTPLSAMANYHVPSSRIAETLISDGPSGRRSLIAFETRLAKTCSIRVGSAHYRSSASGFAVARVTEMLIPN